MFVSHAQNEESPIHRRRLQSRRKNHLQQKPQKKIGLADETILTPNFARLIRETRMKMGLTHEQLGMKMNEKAQILKKFETGSLKPDEIFAKVGTLSGGSSYTSAPIAMRNKCQITERLFS